MQVAARVTTQVAAENRWLLYKWLQPQSNFEGSILGGNE